MKSFFRKLRLTPALRERHRLARLPRYRETTTHLPGFPFQIPDGPSFLASWEENFDRQIYQFKPRTKDVRILDCGANVGVSSLFFHRNFPNAKITAFEPDPKIFAYLKNNLAQAGAHQIELVAKAVWSSSTTLRFQSEGSDAGRIEAAPGKNLIEIPAVRLRDFLNEPVDLLKMDIEGAETEVLPDIADSLQPVENIFLEYHSFAGQPQRLGRVIQLLTEAGFRVHVQPMNVAAQPFVEIKNYLGMDMQLNIFARREGTRA